MPSCAECGIPLDPSALACPACHKLTRSEQLTAWAAEARAATARGDAAGARALWVQCAAILPADTVQYRSIQARIAELDARIGPSPAAPSATTGKWGKSAAGAGSVLLLLLGKGKMLLLGLTKLSTFVSMLAWVGVYWALYGWWFALGSVFSIYVHEMGHVIALRRLGIPADAPMFIPGVGAFVRLRRLSISPEQDSRIGLAGPIYGCGAALAAMGAFYATGSKAWGAIAHFGAVINLFNMIPVWQLDGSRGVRSASSPQRLIIVVLAAGLWIVTS